MRRLITWICAVCLVTVGPLTGCGYVITGTQEHTEEMEPRILEDDVRYVVSGVSVGNDELSVRLDRECSEVREIETRTIETTQRDYQSMWMWITSGGIVFFGESIALFMFLVADEGDRCNADSPFYDGPADCAAAEDLSASAVGVAISTLVIAGGFAGLGLYYELANHDIEKVLDSQVRKETETVACSKPWPIGKVTLMAPFANQSFEGDAHGNGQITVPVDDAKREVWLSNEPLQLALPDSLEWLDVQLPSSVRTAMIGGSEETAERVYVWYEAEEKYADLLKAGTNRVQSALTGSRRYQFVSDSETREQIQAAVERGGGSPEARRQTALEAARAEDVKKVVQLSITPIFETQVQLSLAVYDTATGDQIFATQAPADLSDAFKALEVFDELAESYLSWEHQ